MKRRLLRIILLCTSLFTGWTLGYLRFPYVEQQMGYWVGFLSCLGLLFFISAALYLWNKRPTGRDGMPVFSLGRVNMLWPVLILLLGGATLAEYYRNEGKRSAEVQRSELNRKREFQAIQHAIENSNRSQWMSQILQAAGSELERSSRRELSDALLAQLSALSFGFKPYVSLEQNTLQPIPRSPERGQLLLALISLDLDTGTLMRIKKKVSFASADLRGANIPGTDLSGIDLRGADLSQAVLDSVDLSSANLESALLRRTSLNRARLDGAYLRKADLSFAQLERASLQGCTLNGARLEQAQLRGAGMNKALLHWANLNGAMFRDAEMQGAELMRAEANRADFQGANLSSGQFYSVPVKDANLRGMLLDSCRVHSDWEARFMEARGTQSIKKVYRIVIDSSIVDMAPKHYLIRK